MNPNQNPEPQNDNQYRSEFLSADPPQSPAEPAAPETTNPAPTPVANQAAAAPQQTQPAQITGIPPVTPGPAPVDPMQNLGKNDNQSAGLPPSGKKAGKKKKLIIGGAITLVVICLLGAGAVFGLYLPNKPDAVYKSGLERTGKAVDKLVNDNLTQDKLNEIKSTDLSGKLDVQAAGTSYGGTFNSKFDTKKSDSTVTYKNDQQNVSVQLLSDLADGKTYPDVYLKVSGLSALGLDQFIPQLKDYDGKWISATGDYLASIAPIENKDDSKPNEFGQKEAAELAKIVTNTTRDYVFTSDESKAVIQQKSFVGTEKLDEGITANHYTVGINKANANNYCKALIESIVASDAYKKIPGIDHGNVDENKNDSIKSCQDSINNDIKDTDTFDMWVDKKTKLIHKIRVTDEKDKGTYVEIGQTYKKGSNIPLFVTMHSDKDKYDAKLTLDVDTDKNVTKGSINFTYNGDDKYTANASFEFKPHEGDITIDKPKDAIPIQQVLKAFNFDPAELQQSTSQAEADLL